MKNKIILSLFILITKLSIAQTDKLVTDIQSPIFGDMSKSSCYSDNCTNAYGKYKFSNGAIYQGNFKNNLAHRQGKYTLNDGYSYDGHIANNKH